MKHDETATSFYAKELFLIQDLTDLFTKDAIQHQG